jgi:hypothetical protein
MRTSTANPYHIFVSSTYTDLVDERQTVIQTLLKLHCLPLGMELFPNGDPDVWRLIQQLIRRCDIYILVVAGRYGSEARGEGISFTEKEYRFALELRKPILVYPHKTPHTHKPELSADEGEQKKAALKTFLESVTARSTKPWSSDSELAGNIAIDLATELRKLDRSHAKRHDSASALMEAEIRALEARFEEPQVLRLTKLLRSTIYQFQFEQIKDRLLKLGEMLPWLSEREWVLLTDFARAQIMVRAEGHALIEPMKRAAVSLAEHYQAQLREFYSGVLVVEGELINTVSAQFMSAVQHSFRALSNDDIQFWESNDSQEYYANNRRLIERNVQVERVFICPRSTFTSASMGNVLRRQVSDGIKVRIMSLEDAKAFAPTQQELDFGLHDGFAVSFFRNYFTRSFRVDTNHHTVERFMKRFAEVSQRAQVVPGKVGADNRVVETIVELERWLQAVRQAV